MPARRSPSLHCCLWVLALGVGAFASAAPICSDEATCKAHIGSLVDRLAQNRDKVHRKQHTVGTLEELRTGVFGGQRVALPSAQRQVLERESPSISQVTYDLRHRPLSTNVSQHLTPLGTLAQDSTVRLHDFFAIKPPSVAQSKKAKGSSPSPPTVLVTVDAASMLTIWNPDGEAVLDNFDLGHGPGRTVSRLVLSHKEENHYAVTVDDLGVVRVHSFKFMSPKQAKRSSPSKQDVEEDVPAKKMLVTSNFTCSFSLATGGEGDENRKLTTILPIDRGQNTYFVVGDSLGTISVFFQNGTIKGRVRVTEDPGGLIGLVRSNQAQTVLFYSSHSFGFFSAVSIDVQFPPCSGWNSPVFDVVMDPGTGSGRVILALSDGDVIVFSTSSGKAKACDLTFKFPRVSSVPFKLRAVRGHIMGLPTPTASIPNKSDHTRELFFFNLAAMEAGYGSAPSKALAVQASFGRRQPDRWALAATSPQDRLRSQIALSFVGEQGVELFDLSLKLPTPPKAAGGSGGAAEGWLGILEWMPKMGIFGMTMIGVVMWQMRKPSASRSSKSSSDSGYDEDMFRELMQQRREKKKRENAGAGQVGRPAVEED